LFTSQDNIRAFIERVARAFPNPGTLYLVGECSLVVESVRKFCTEVIIALDVDAEYVGLLTRAVDEAAREVELTVCIEHPETVIPLPDSARGGERRVSGLADDTFGPLRIRHFDPYSVAIRFIARGDQPDYDLALALLTMGWIDIGILREKVDALLDSFSFDTIQQDPAEFRRKFKGLNQMWIAQHSNSDAA